jgi:uncharacterized phage-associated protein
MAEDFVFSDKDELVLHIYKRLDNPTLLKVQKSLYFLWAYYSGTYGNVDKSEETDLDQTSYPTSLFKPEFKAWRYGPVDDKVYAKQKSGCYSEDKWKEYHPKNSEEIEVVSFINDLLSQINKVNDFGLVNRSHEDESWSRAFRRAHGKPHAQMNPDEIRQEYAQVID